MLVIFMTLQNMIFTSELISHNKSRAKSFQIRNDKRDLKVLKNKDINTQNMCHFTKSNMKYKKTYKVYRNHYQSQITILRLHKIIISCSTFKI